MLAIGRDPETKKIGLDKAGVTLNSAGKIPTTNERTNVPHIYAIGDIITVSSPPPSLSYKCASHCSVLGRSE